MWGHAPSVTRPLQLKVTVTAVSSPSNCKWFLGSWAVAKILKTDNQVGLGVIWTLVAFLVSCSGPMLARSASLPDTTGAQLLTSPRPVRAKFHNRQSDSTIQGSNLVNNWPRSLQQIHSSSLSCSLSFSWTQSHVKLLLLKIKSAYVHISWINKSWLLSQINYIHRTKWEQEQRVMLLSMCLFISLLYKHPFICTYDTNTVW